MRKTVSGIMLILLLMSMLAMVFSVQQVKAEPETWTKDEDGAANFRSMQEGYTSKYSSLSANDCINTRKWSRSEIDGFGQPSVAAGEWNFDRVEEWGNFAYVSNSSAELVVGVCGTQPNGYSKLMDLIVQHGGELVNTVSMEGQIRALVANIPSVETPAFVSEAHATNLSRYIEPNLRFEVDFAPNDPMWPLQWAPTKIKADYAWNTTIGDPSVLVAIIDTGVDWDHPDLAANYVALGYDWVNNDTDPMDDHGHGTHCAGIIAAVINNDLGIAGLAQARIMAEKGINASGFGTADDLANAIAHAVDQGADILSLSWGAYVDSALIHEAIKYAYDNGVLVVAAAGNDGTNIKQFPAAYDEVIAVAATDQYDNTPWWSNYGDWIELAAPGVRVYSTVWNDSYTYMSGTSMSAPHVAGVAALIWSQFPNMTGDQVRVQLRLTADDLGNPGFDYDYGYGMVNARRAVEQAPPDHDLLVFDFEIPQFLHLWHHETATINATILNFGTTNESNVIVWQLINSTLVNSTIFSFLASGARATVSFSWTPTVEGVYNVTSYVMPTPNETIMENNAISGYVTVRTLEVPKKYPTIQKAINVAFPGETIFVSSGTYYENVVVDKTVSLIGENRSTTIIDGSGKGTVVTVWATNVKLIEFTIQHGFDHGIYLPQYSGYNNISANIVTNNNQGVHLYYSFLNTLMNNDVVNNTYSGIELDHSVYDTLKGNGIKNSMYNFRVSGLGHSSYIHYIDTSNTVNGNPIYYWVNEHDMQIPADAGYVGVINCRNITVKDLNLTDNGQGVLFVDTINSTIENVNSSNNYDGLSVAYSSNNTIIGNTVSNYWIGIGLSDSNNNIVNGNVISRGEGGIGIYDSVNNTIISNAVLDNWLGIEVFDSNGNDIYHNNFINNMLVYSLFKSYNNTWDNGYPSGGNYWSDYTGLDLYRGPYQNETGSDGFGDTPYVIDADNRDRYPFMNPWSPPEHNIALSNIVLSKTVVGQGYSLKINVTAANQGDYEETFNVTVYANITTISQIEVTLTSGNSTTITLTWNTTRFAKGNYTISAYASPVSNETDTADNTFTDGWVIVAMVGDIAGPDGWPDGKVDMISDIRAVVKVFGVVYPNPRYNPNCDINDDGIIDLINDIRTVAKHFGDIDP